VIVTATWRYSTTMMLPAGAHRFERHFSKTAQMFDIEMEQIAGAGARSESRAQRSGRGCDSDQSAKDAADGGATQAGG